MASRKGSSRKGGKKMSRLPVDITTKFEDINGVSPLIKMLLFVLGNTVIGGAIAYGSLTALEKWAG